MHIDRPGYSGRIYEAAGLRKHAEFVLAKLAELKGQFDFVAVTGKSGMAVAFAALAIGPGFDLVTVRKGEKAHGRDIEGRAKGERYVIVDDLIDSGSTVRRIDKQLRDEFRSEDAAKLVGVILYSYDGFYRDGSKVDVDEAGEVPVYGPKRGEYL